jgi:hypothetical protein
MPNSLSPSVGPAPPLRDLGRKTSVDYYDVLPGDGGPHKIVHRHRTIMYIGIMAIEMLATPCIACSVFYGVYFEVSSFARHLVPPLSDCSLVLLRYLLDSRYKSSS